MKKLNALPVVSASLLLSLLTVACTQSNKSNPVTLSPTGLSVTTLESTNATELSFGDSMTDVSTTLEAVLGESVGRIEDTECGLLLNAWEDNLMTVEKDNQFVGWAVQRSDSGSTYTTADGLGIGSTRKQLEAISELESKKEGDHSEFETANGYKGGLNGGTPDAVIYTFSAGESCENPDYPWPQPHTVSLFN